MGIVKSMYQQEMRVDIVDFNDVFKWECLSKVKGKNKIRPSFSHINDLLGSRIGRQSNLFKHHMRKINND